MKKLLFIGVLVLGIAAYVYFHFSTPQVLNRRLGSLLDTMSFGAIELKENAKLGDEFTSHFAKEVRFSGVGNDLIVGSPSREDLRDLYLEQLRTFARNCKATTVGDTNIIVQQVDLAQMETTIQLTGNLHGNTSFERSMPVQFTWEKQGGSWVITAVRLRDPAGSSAL